MLDFPGEYEIINKGINGHTTGELLNRIEEDVINLKPDVVTVLVGFNDVNQTVWKTPKAMCCEESRIALEKIAKKLKEKLPLAKVIFMGAYYLDGTITQKDFKVFSEEVPKRAKNARVIAEKLGFHFVSLQETFDKAKEKMPDIYWSTDGVHPTSAGHEIIKREWIRAFKSL